MNVRERIQFHNNLAKSSPEIDQKNRIQGNLYKKSLLLSEKITKIRERNNFELNAPKNHLNKDNDINRKEVVAANKIKHCFRDHLEKLEKMESEGLYTNKGFIKTTYNGDNKSIHGREYYHCRNKDHPIVYKPSEIPSGVENGSFKIVTRKDDRFIALEPVDINDRFQTDNNFNDIKDIRSMKTGLAVSTKLIIACNAGKNVFDCINYGDAIPDSAFKNAANDLKTLHQRNGYLRDIKPENTAYDGKQVNFIDVDDRISKDTDQQDLKFKLHGEQAICTRNYITEKLLGGIYDKNDRISNNKDVAKYLKAADEYAFLLTIIAATTKSKKLRKAIISPTSDRNTRKLGLLNKLYLREWVDQHVKSQHRDRVRLLFSAPDEYAVPNNDIYLSDVLKFSDK
ncbi:hypothetical protein [Yersinia mollaretii]|uniref:Protein kinase domain-containing protein n=1 Tax=Yersinia mollaretii TaxID=33060 RepID=A0AA36LPZ8_YERMO|nr:hypothetical protein [Yersinia mollaretii]MDA5528931.1 hypothetical protein [Yersinia mollaretii]MDR7875451.1 hypothetical protein [Yersinia mollaretii]PHZ30041.1 hypothetical protein CS537_19125 [Yersinia mollaretii]WQC75198.1 hypothetical protein U1Z61_01230 [Yersinia mollaretii]CNF26883.1 Uncharacterised protein [Yersinia mollaretii]